MKKFVCPVCGYVHEAEEMAADFRCPLCRVPGSKFKVMEEGKLAAVHEYGVYGKTVKNNPDISEEDKKYIFDQLMANFNGECAEVGMYLCMARIAHREGYPEIGLYWEKAAYEEAEHAAKFAELLGECLTDSTKKNLEMRVAAENGATAGKFELAKMAKEGSSLAAQKQAVDTYMDTTQRKIEIAETLLEYMFVKDIEDSSSTNDSNVNEARTDAGANGSDDICSWKQN